MHGWWKYYVFICTLSYSWKYCRMNKCICNSDSEQTWKSWAEYTSNFLLSGQWVISSVLSHLNKNLRRWTLKPSTCHSSQTDHVSWLSWLSWLSDRPCDSSWTDWCYSSVLFTAQFYLENKRKIHPQGMRACRSRDQIENRAPALWLLFLCFFPPPGPALCKLG